MKLSTTKMLPNLPEDFLIEIFSRSHTKLVGSCKCLSKSWNTYLSSESFIKIHLSRRRTTHENLLLWTNWGTLHLKAHPIKDHVVSKSLPQHILKYVWDIGRVVGSCNGLVLLLDKKARMSVVNLITQQKVKVPCPRSKINMRGFGYDSFNDDYKIIASYFGTFSKTGAILVNVYSLKTGLWKELVSPYDKNYHDLHIGPYLNGAIYCSVGYSGDPIFRTIIAAFDLAKELFIVVSPPPDVGVFESLNVVGGYLCMMNKNVTISMTELWIMKDYGLSESWTKLVIAEPFDNGMAYKEIQPLCFIDENEEAILARISNGLAVYNLKDGTKKSINHWLHANDFDGGCTFIDSLVSPEYFKHSDPVVD